MKPLAHKVAEMYELCLKKMLDFHFDAALLIVLCCYGYSRLLHYSVEIPTFHLLNNPNYIRDFIRTLLECFTTEEANKVGEALDFNKRKVKRLLFYL